MSNKSTGLGVTLLDMARLTENHTSEKYIQITDIVQFSLYTEPSQIEGSTNALLCAHLSLL